ncbi:hypothetical protein GPECTOR_45g175 [Gonium pectorale]|uniref:Uncharacterized protein n=1 Tax=Gonium pectorale TaxID=33097 RepID=A0A150G9R5_GONPE|nr:hypothetical protein GPECTOR_45g175 [Gonium pectorale]|eukprot:KXZ46305.1 hypothetical protein GPECTOR_45g175 [Gonium pectorale]
MNSAPESDMARALQQQLLAQGVVLPESVNLQQALANAHQTAAVAGEAGSDGGDTDTDNEDGSARRVARSKQGKTARAGDKVAAGRAAVARHKGGKEIEDDGDADDRKGGKGGKNAAGKDGQPRKKHKTEAAVADAVGDGWTRVRAKDDGRGALQVFRLWVCLTRSETWMS